MDGNIANYMLEALMTLDADAEKLTRYQKWHLRVTVAACLVATGSLIAFTIQMHHFTEQSKRQTEAMKIQAFQALGQTWAQIDNVFINRPSLRRFFYEGASPKVGSQEHQITLGVSELMLDLFELFFTMDANGNVAFPGTDPTQRSANENYMRSVFLSSPVMCERLRGAGAWYSEKLKAFAAPPCAKYPQTTK